MRIKKTFSKDEPTIELEISIKELQVLVLDDYYLNIINWINDNFDMSLPSSKKNK